MCLHQRPICLRTRGPRVKGVPTKILGRASLTFFLFFLLGASGGKETVEQFFARLKKKYHWTDQGKMKDVVSELRKNEVNTVDTLKELWEDVKGEIQLSIGMKKCLEVEIQKVW